MKLFNWEIKKTVKDPMPREKKETPSLQNTFTSAHEYRNLQPIIQVPFDGEKTPGELGPIYDVLPDYNRLRLRAYEATIRTDLVGLITKRFFRAILGKGLKIQAEPEETVLKTESITADFDEFRETVEARFRLWGKSKRASYTSMQNLHALANDAYRTAFLGGDCLVILRVDKGIINIQVIDGQQVKTPFLNTEFNKAAVARGNDIKYGIELDKKGKHIAYYVCTTAKNGIGSTFKRIPAKGAKTGRLLAFMIYGSKHRIDHHRGIPAITSILEKVNKLDRYTEATVGTAEERAKIVYSIEHNRDSTGENILEDNLKQAMGMGNPNAQETEGYALGEKTAAKIAATTSKQAFNMPIGSKMTALTHNQEIYFEQFWKAIFYTLCASVEIPPEVALQAYNSNYSASKAAQNAWGEVIEIIREKFAQDFYQPIYNLWLELEVIKNKVTAPQYLQALSAKNFMAIEAYSNARFVGPRLSHIDPLKEIKAVREMIDEDLIGKEQGVEMLNLGDWRENYKKVIAENKIIENNTPKESIVKQDGTSANKTSNKV